MSNGTKVKKRNGSIEPLDLEKMHLMVEKACEGLGNVSSSQVEIQSGIQFYDGITTDEIQEILIKSASDLISLDHPNYQFVAARLLLFGLRKSLYGKMHDHPHLWDHVGDCIDKGVYDPAIPVHASSTILCIFSKLRDSSPLPFLFLTLMPLVIFVSKY